MTIALTGVSAISSTRVRLRFTNSIAIGAFDASLYSVTSIDAASASPYIKKVLAVSGIPNMVELVLGGTLSGDARYDVSAVGVPATDTSVTAAGSIERLVYGAPQIQRNTEPRVSDADVVLYGRDIAFSGIDFIETADHDLAIVSGIANAASAVTRRLTGSPLPYAPNYSPNSRDFVDSNDSSELRTRLQRQALADNRVKAVAVDVAIGTDGYPIFTITPTFVGDVPTAPISISVKT